MVNFKRTELAYFRLLKMCFMFPKGYPGGVSGVIEEWGTVYGERGFWAFISL